MSAVTAEDQLFETGSMASGPSPSPRKVPVDKTFRCYDQDQSFLMPPSLRDWLPEDHLAHFVSELVDEVLDLSPFLASYTEVRGYPPYHPRLMLKILLYGYTTGVRSSRKIELRSREDVAFRFLSANAAPDFRSVARFRRRHLAALEALFTEALTLCRAAGMVKMGRVALDGTKVRANASRHKAMSYDRMADTEARLREEVQEMMREAERVDAEEDPQAPNEERQDRLRPAQGDRRAGLRADEDHPRSRPTPAARSSWRPIRVEASRCLPQPAKAGRLHRNGEGGSHLRPAGRGCSGSAPTPADK